MAMKALLFLLACVLLVSTKAAAYAPKKAPAHAPVYPPKKAPAVAPTPPPVMADAPEIPHYHGCSGQCVKYCDTNKSIGKHKKRYCQRICTVCCSKCKCIPAKDKSCPDWNGIYYHGSYVKCP